MDEILKSEELNKYYRNFIVIDLDAIESNIDELQKSIGSKTKLVAVIKTDGYGHGAVPIAKTVDKKVAAYAVATIEEAFNLRNHGISKPIYVLGFIHESQFERMILEDIRATVYDFNTALSISQVANRINGKLESLLEGLNYINKTMNKLTCSEFAKNRVVKIKELQAKVHIKIDTGMGRIGFPDNEETVDIIESISKLPDVSVEGIFTHFAASDEEDKSSANSQLERFKKVLEALDERKIKIPVKHMYNSAAIIDFEEDIFNQARAGIALYGLYPSEEVKKENVNLHPALSLYTHIIHIKKVPKGTGISYGSTFVTKRESKIATLPIGYGDGYKRNISNQGFVIINGKRAPIVGRVCMDQMMVDITDIEAKKGDLVTLIGTEGDESISVEELSEYAKTFNYEFVCDLGKRIPRVYVRKGKIVCMKDYFVDKYNIK